MKCFEIVIEIYNHILQVVLTVNMKCFEITLKHKAGLKDEELTVNMKCFEMIIIQNKVRHNFINRKYEMF